MIHKQFIKWAVELLFVRRFEKALGGFTAATYNNLVLDYILDYRMASGLRMLRLKGLTSDRFYVVFAE